MKNDELDEMMGSATMISGAKSQQSKSSNGSIINSGDGFNVLIIGDGHISLPFQGNDAIAVCLISYLFHLI